MAETKPTETTAVAETEATDFVKIAKRDLKKWTDARGPGLSPAKTRAVELTLTGLEAYLKADKLEKLEAEVAALKGT